MASNDNIFSKAANIEFLQEPAYAWACFFVAVSLFGFAWRGALGFMRG